MRRTARRVPIKNPHDPSWSALRPTENRRPACRMATEEPLTSRDPGCAASGAGRSRSRRTATHDPHQSSKPLSSEWFPARAYRAVPLVRCAPRASDLASSYCVPGCRPVAGFPTERRRSRRRRRELRHPKRGALTVWFERCNSNSVGAVTEQVDHGSVTATRRTARRPSLTLPGSS
jgi:hypothetical protein